MKDALLSAGPARGGEIRSPPAAGASVPPPPMLPYRTLLCLAVNAYLVAFTLDGVLSLLVDAGALLGATPAGTLLSRLTGFVVIGGSFALLGVIVLTPSLPRAILMPVATFPAASFMGIIPWTLWMTKDLEVVELVRLDITMASGRLPGLFVGHGALCVLQLILAGATFRRLGRLVPGRRAWLHPDALPAGGFRARALLRSLVGATLAVGALVPAWLGLTLEVFSRTHLEAAFVDVDLGHLWTRMRTYARGEKRIVLMGMVHVARDTYYREMIRALPERRSLVLLEGVTDRTRRIRSFGYGRLASRLGLEVQNLRFDPRWFEVRRADVDTEEFADLTISALDAVGSVLTARGPEAAGQLLALQRLMETPGILETLERDIFRRRNETLARHMQEGLADWDVLVVPWGAAHLPDIARRIGDWGFTLEEERIVPAIAFPSLLVSLLRDPGPDRDRSAPDQRPPGAAPDRETEEDAGGEGKTRGAKADEGTGPGHGTGSSGGSSSPGTHSRGRH